MKPNPACVVKVGYGRGFVMNQRVSVPRLNRSVPPSIAERRLVITAAHCLPKFPPPHAHSYLKDRTYKNLLRTLNGRGTGVWAECLFADPVADIAVLGCPDEQELPEEADAYNEFIDAAPTVSIGEVRSGKGWVLALDEPPRWIPTTLKVFSGGGGISLTIDATQAGMSGSPILNFAGKAVGIVVAGTECVDTKTGNRTNQRAGGQPILTRNLPGWLLERGRREP